MMVEKVTYSKELLQRGGGGEELSFEELQAENYNREQVEVEEKLKPLSEEEKLLVGVGTSDFGINPGVQELMASNASFLHPGSTHLNPE